MCGGRARLERCKASPTMTQRRWSAAMMAMLWACGSADDGSANTDDSATDAAPDTHHAETAADVATIDAPDDTAPPPDAPADAIDASHDADGGTPPDAPAGWILTWADEFDGADGSAVDASRWNYDIGSG